MADPADSTESADELPEEPAGAPEGAASDRAADEPRQQTDGEAGPGPGKLAIFPPLMTSEVWDRIAEAPWEDGGWLIKERPCFFVVVEQDGMSVWDLWFKKYRRDDKGIESDEYEVDPPNKYPMVYRDWVKIASGTLDPESNIIAKHDRTFLLLAVGTNVLKKAAVVEFG